jgi:hypothetical protein
MTPEVTLDETTGAATITYPTGEVVECPGGLRQAEEWLDYLELLRGAKTADGACVVLGF